MIRSSCLAVLLPLIASCSLIAPFEPRDDLDADPDSNVIVRSDADRAGDADGDGDGDNDVDVDGDADGDGDEDHECVLARDFYQGVLDDNGCPGFDGDLPEIVIDRDCLLDTRECRFMCGISVETCTMLRDVRYSPATAGDTCLVVAQRLEVAEDATLTISSPAGVAFVIRDEIVIRGTIDASGRGRDESPGGYPGGGPGEPGGGPLIDRITWGAAGASMSASGGGGGALFGPGGAGGCDGGGGGAPYADCGDLAFMGGTGGGGGSASTGTPTCTDAEAGHGGAGGGIVLLIALRSIEVSATGAVIARGADGGDGCDYAGGRLGGGGGGSGGQIRLNSASVVVEGVLDARGGDGGGWDITADGGPGGTSSSPAEAGGCHPTGVGWSSGGGGGAGVVAIQSVTRELVSRGIYPRDEGCIGLTTECAER